uniref:FadR/GntR family transcriptional regulator n=1 Tax=Ningiella ruwaisensis TaxID=2364274 RepID=UPI001F4F122E|nr:FadR/GntR family transcriptional regulator [Ningiella ruwaisensis]
MKRLYQQIASKLLNEITSGNYELHQRLPSERELAERYEVSRPTIREAIIALEISGVVEVRNGAGVFVISLKPGSDETSDNDIGPFELLEARRLFESEAAALAASQVTDEELEAMAEAVEAMERDNKANVQNLESADREFHMLIARATKNNAIEFSIAHLWDVRNHSPLCMRLLDQVRSKGIQPRVDEHRQILNALEKRDPQAARKAMKEHLTRVIDMVFEATEIEAIEQAKRALEQQRNRFLKSDV